MTQRKRSEIRRAGENIRQRQGKAFAMRIGRAAPKPVGEMGKLRARLVSAGYRAEEALVLFVGIRVGCALAFFSIASLPFMMPRSLMTYR